MTEPGGHADSHDLDKLERWSRALASAAAPGFPVWAVFLVAPEDRVAHDVFREFRSSFSDMGADFQHLVIFGQHGVSTTVQGLTAGLRLSPGSLPLLALFPGPSGATGTMFHTLTLTKGGYGKDAASSETAGQGPWRAVLDWLPAGADGKTLDESPIPELERRALGSSSLEALVSGLLAG